MPTLFLLRWLSPAGSDTEFKLTAAARCPGPEQGTGTILAMTKCLGTEAKSCNSPGPLTAGAVGVTDKC